MKWNDEHTELLEAGKDVLFAGARYKPLTKYGPLRSQPNGPCFFCGFHLKPTDTYSCPQCGWKVEDK